MCEIRLGACGAPRVGIERVMHATLEAEYGQRELRRNDEAEGGIITTCKAVA